MICRQQIRSLGSNCAHEFIDDVLDWVILGAGVVLCLLEVQVAAGFEDILSRQLAVDLLLNQIVHSFQEILSVLKLISLHSKTIPQHVWGYSLWIPIDFLVIKLNLHNFIKEVFPVLLLAYPPNQIPLSKIEIAWIIHFSIWTPEYHFDDIFAVAIDCVSTL